MHNSITTCMSHYYPRHVSGLDMPILRKNKSTNTASGILALLSGCKLHRLRADCSCSSWAWACQGPKRVEDSNVTYMLLLNCALKLVEEIILYYDARSIKHQMLMWHLVMHSGGKCLLVWYVERHSLRSVWRDIWHCTLVWNFPNVIVVKVSPWNVTWKHILKDCMK